MADTDPDTQAALEKVHSAEREVAVVRFAVIALNIAVYYWIMDRSIGVPRLADAISILATIYALYVILARPYVRFPILATAAVTATMDTTLITLWLIATGSAASPFWVLWYVSLVAVAYRFDHRWTMALAGVYAAIDLAIQLVPAGATAITAEHLIRPAYVLFVGATAALISRNAYGQAAARFQHEQRATGLEAEVQRRTRDLEESRARLRNSLDELREAHTRLRGLDALKTEILNTTSHELNTPLTPIRLQVHMLESGGAGPLDEKQRRAVSVMRRNVERLQELVQDMVDVARLQGGRLAMTTKTTNIAELLDDVTHVFEPSAEQQEITLTTQLPPDRPLEITADPDRLSQVFFNLISNALKFTPKGGTIHVEADESTMPNGDAAVYVDVNDTGVGLTADQIGRLFRPFARVHDKETNDPAGTGLGLYICHGIVTRHGGMIGARSDGPGQGSSFRVLLPVRPNPRSEAEEQETLLFDPDRTVMATKTPSTRSPTT